MEYGNAFGTFWKKYTVNFASYQEFPYFISKMELLERLV